MFERAATDAVTFFVVANLVGLVPMSISITRQEPPSSQRRIALRGVLNAATILIIFVGIGQILLNATGIRLASFKIAGGLVLPFIAMKMILEDEAVHEPAVGDGTGLPDAGRTSPHFPGDAVHCWSRDDHGHHFADDDERFSVRAQAVTTAVLLIVLALTYGMLLARGDDSPCVGNHRRQRAEPRDGTRPDGAGRRGGPWQRSRRLFAVLTVSSGNQQGRSMKYCREHEDHWH